MKQDLETRSRKNYVVFRIVRDFTMGGLILAMGLILLLGDKFNLEVISDIDPVMRYGFGSLCLLYGGFRLYRGIKHDY